MEKDIKNKLITLFKQCCNNDKFDKKKSMNSNGYGIQRSISTSTCEININEELKTSLTNIGFVKFIHDDSFIYFDDDVISFYFDEAPCLQLALTNSTINLELARENFEIHDVVKFNSIEKASIIKGRFLGFRIKSRRHVPIKSRLVILKKQAFNNINEFKNNKLSEPLADVDFKLYPSQRTLLIEYDNNESLHPKTDYVFSPTIRKVHSSIDEVNDSLYSQANNFRLKVKGGVIKMGNVAAYVDYKTYLELKKFYDDSIKQQDIDLLDARIKNTK